MSLSKKLKWKKSVNEFKFVTEELKLTKDIIRSVGAEFQEFYEKYLESKALDLHKLNQENKKRINAQERADSPEEEPPPCESSRCTDLVVYKQIYSKEETEQAEAEYALTQDDIELHEAFAKLFQKNCLGVAP